MLLGFLLGLLVGGVIVLLVYRNNLARFTALADKFNKQIEDLKNKSK